MFDEMICLWKEFDQAFIKNFSIKKFDQSLY